MKVRVNAGGREVEIECTDSNMSPKDVRDLAIQAWQATDGARAPSEGPAYGFQANAAGRQVSPMNMGGYGRGYVGEPRAGDPS